MGKDTSTRRKPDLGFQAIVALLVVVAAWLLLMPWVPAIASATMHRFHLRSGSFASWAIQQPIPSMYNFANRFEMREIPAGFLDPIFETDQKRYINHFPTRVLTFANTRYHYLHQGRDQWLTIDTSYRGQSIESVYHAKPIGGGGFEMTLLPSASQQ